jgi:predicted O-methyltransferase YrrM
VTVLLLLASVTLAVAESVTLKLYLQERRERHQRNRARPRPIPLVRLEQVDPVFRADAFGPTLETEVSFVGRGPIDVQGTTSDGEAWILAVLAKHALRLFEFGTCTGRTAYLWARNAPPEARIITLTLPPDGRAAYQRDPADADTDTMTALSESSFTKFLYTGTAAAAKIEQLYGDSKALDVSLWAGQCDLVFVDGSHAYSYVRSDSEKALALVRPGGLVLWHDYAGPDHSPGVYRALNELRDQVPLVHIAGTMLVAFRRPLTAAPDSMASFVPPPTPRSAS